ncbi:ArsR/SmtB family transcription factor [Sphingorhabdus buctiana]|uniref:ArsR/SmtB family transcription factor n=1 Tax=Sphingorhabdus buctiana TaxID=1508805 RepID=A0ABW4MBT4_9SPHN
MLKCESRLDCVFHALSDPGRRSMIDRLAVGPASLGQLAAPLAMSLPAVQQHLGVLERAGLVKTEKLGRVRQCRLDGDGVAFAENWLAERRLHWNRRFDRLEKHIKGDRT